MAGETKSGTSWQQSGLQALGSLDEASLPAFEMLFLDDVAGYLMGAGPLKPPYTIEHVSRVISMLFQAMVNSHRFAPEDSPTPTPQMESAREAMVLGAHNFAANGMGGLTQLLDRLTPAILGELEINQDAPEEQTCSLFCYSLLAVASGPANLLSDEAAAGVVEIFQAWGELFGRGVLPPWRQAAEG